jgi:hypothetical protein
MGRNYKGDSMKHNKWIFFDEDTYKLYVKIQDGPIKEVGLNGVQIDDIIVFAREFIEELNKIFPCRENSIAITKLQEAEFWLDARKKDREKRGVEGENQL